jgi:hypothetical protein
LVDTYGELMTEVDDPESPASIAAETYKAEVSVPGWSISFEAVEVDAEGNTFVPTSFVRDSDKKTVIPDRGVCVWGPSRVDQMDPETSGSIAAAVARQDIETGRTEERYRH